MFEVKLFNPDYQEINASLKSLLWILAMCIIVYKNIVIYPWGMTVMAPGVSFVLHHAEVLLAWILVNPAYIQTTDINLALDLVQFLWNSRNWLLHDSLRVCHFCTVLYSIRTECLTDYSQNYISNAQIPCYTVNRALWETPCSAFALTGDYQWRTRPIASKVSTPGPCK